MCFIGWIYNAFKYIRYKCCGVWPRLAPGYQWRLPGGPRNRNTTQLLQVACTVLYCTVLYCTVTCTGDPQTWAALHCAKPGILMRNGWKWIFGQGHWFSYSIIWLGWLGLESWVTFAVLGWGPGRWLSSALGSRRWCVMAKYKCIVVTRLPTVLYWSCTYLFIKLQHTFYFFALMTISRTLQPEMLTIKPT